VRGYCAGGDNASCGSAGDNKRDAGGLLCRAARLEPSDEVKKVVAKVFDDGETATDREILYFYAPALCQSLWHESQTYVCTIGGHRFFEEAER